MKQRLLRCKQINSNEVHFFDRDADWVTATLPKIYSLASTFQGFPSDLLLSIKILRYFKKIYFQEKPFVVAANPCKVFKIFIPTKIIYSGPGIKVRENLIRLAFRTGVYLY